MLSTGIGCSQEPSEVAVVVKTVPPSKVISIKDPGSANPKIRMVVPSLITVVDATLTGTGVEVAVGVAVGIAVSVLVGVALGVLVAVAVGTGVSVGVAVGGGKTTT